MHACLSTGSITEQQNEKLPREQRDVWHVLVKTSAVAYEGAQVPHGRLWHIWMSVLFDVSVVAAIDTLLKYEDQGSTFLWLLVFTFHTLSDVNHCGSLSPEPPEAPLFTCWDSLCLIASQGGVLSLVLWFYDFLITPHGSLWKLKAVFWILHKWVRGIDNKMHSSRNNEVKQNGNVHCSLRCWNYREMLTLFF